MTTNYQTSEYEQVRGHWRDAWEHNEGVMTHLLRYPNADQDEKMLLAYCLRNPIAIPEVYAALFEGEAVYRIPHREMLRAMYRYWQRYDDSWTFDQFFSWLETEPPPRRIEDVDNMLIYIGAKVVNEVALRHTRDFAGISVHVDRVVSAHRARLLMRGLSQAAQSLEPDEYGISRIDTEAAMAQVSELMTRVSQLTSGEDPATPATVANKLRTHAQRLIDGDAVRHRAGIRPLDAIMRWEEATYNILAAYSGHGKTTLASAIIAGLAREPGFVVDVHQCEVPQHAQCARLLAAHINATATSRFDQLPEHFMLAIDDVSEKNQPHAFARMDGALRDWFEQRDIFLEPAGALDLAKIERRTHAMRARFPDRPLLVVVDYIQRVFSRDATGQGERERITYVSGKLQALAKDTGAILLVASQYTHDGSRDLPKRMPDAEQVRGSKDILMDADNVITFHRPWTGHAEFDSLGIIEVGKGRYNSQAHVLAHSDMALNTFDWWGERRRPEVITTGLLTKEVRPTPHELDPRY